jgi:2-amino-4-hydroxy-6-hydroxymethyldihydropteridine diphosphokinase
MALLAIGANVAGAWGTPRETLTRLPMELELLGIAVEAAAALIETPPFGPIAQPAFLNGALRIRTCLPPLGLLSVVKALERSAGRKPGERWGPRPLDVDIVAYGNRVMRAGRADGPLEIPHPGLAERDFVLRPLAEIAPDWRHPVTGLTAGEMLARLGR